MYVFKERINNRVVRALGPVAWTADAPSAAAAAAAPAPANAATPAPAPAAVVVAGGSSAVAEAAPHASNTAGPPPAPTAASTPYAAPALSVDAAAPSCTAPAPRAWQLNSGGPNRPSAPDGSVAATAPPERERKRQRLYRGLLVELPAPGTWISAVWPVGAKHSSVLSGLVVHHVRRGTGSYLARVLWDDGEWMDMPLTQLGQLRATVFASLDDVPNMARTAVQAVLVTMDQGTYSYYGDNNRYVTCNFLGPLKAWTRAQWQAAGLLPLPPAPAQGASSSGSRVHAPGAPPGGVAGPTPGPAAAAPSPAPPPRTPAHAPAPGVASLADTVAARRARYVTAAARAGIGPSAGGDAPAPAPAPTFPDDAFGAGPSRRPLADTPLRLATHNVTGLTSRTAVFELVQAWAARDLDVVFVQETWVGSAASRARHHTEVDHWIREANKDLVDSRGFGVVWGERAADGTTEGRGVATFFRLSDGLVVKAATASASGRLQTVNIRWAGHDFPVVNSYWPCTSAAARATFLEEEVVPAMAAAGTASVAWLVGDFNFVESPGEDRRPPVPASTVASDASTTGRFRDALPSIVDSYRSLFSGRTGYTLHRGAECAARLDRLYHPVSVTGLVSECGVGISPRGDHNFCFASLAPLVAPPAPGPGRRPVPASVLACPPAAQALEIFARRQVQASADIMEDNDLLDWFPHMTSSLEDECRRHQHLQRASRAAARQQVAAAAEAADTAARAVETAVGEQQRADAAALCTAATQAYRSIAREAALPPVASAAEAWHTGSGRPSTLISQALRPPARRTTIPPIRTPAGSLAGGPGGPAGALNRSFSSVSAKAPTDPVKQQAILAALRADIQAGAINSIPAGLAAAAGEDPITPAEVIAALAASDLGSSPGPDRLPYGAWRVGKDCMAPLLARVFNAMLTAGRLPDGFNTGTITPVPKPGAADPHAASSYRPITLLNTIYRVLARILAARFGRALAPAIGVEQSAFLPERLIDDAVLLAELLPHLLAMEGVTGVARRLDIAKAFDSVDRDFLFEVMREMGASPGMIAWARLLLTDTCASTHANGVESGLRRWEAGVRQGCPLSPLLYLFVAQALASSLRAQPELGISVAGLRVVSSHFADDGTVFEQGASEAVSDTTMATLAAFGSAFNQHTNPSKSSAMIIGAVPEASHLPATLGGVTVVQHTVALGVPCSNSATRTASPQQPPSAAGAITRASLRPSRETPAPLPAHVAAALGRRLGAAERLVSLIQALPLSAMGRGVMASAYACARLAYLAQFVGLPASPIVAAFVSRVSSAVGPGVPHALLGGRPRDGGFGLLPVQAHAVARHASMATRLLCHLLRPPPASTPTPSETLLASPPATPLLPARTPPWTVIAGAVLKRVCPDLHPAQTLLLATAALPEDVACGVLGTPGVRQVQRVPPGTLTLMLVALQSLGPLALPAAMADGGGAARRILAERPPAAAAPAELGNLAWCATDPVSARPLPPLLACKPAPVKRITALLTAGVERRRLGLQVAYAAAAHHPAQRGQSFLRSEVDTLRKGLHCLWTSPVDKRVLEPLWRMGIDAVPGGRVASWVCPCAQPGGAPCPVPRHHSFWDCPVAVAVRSQLEASLAPAPLSRSALWLLRPPSPAVNPQVWPVVCAAALEAMDYGRRRLWGVRIGLQTVAGGGGATGAQLGQEIVAGVAALSAERFWLTLQEFVATAGTATCSSLGPLHPFVSTRGT